MKAEIGEMQPQAKECRLLRETVRAKEGFSPRAPRGNEALSTLVFCLLASRTVRE